MKNQPERKQQRQPQMDFYELPSGHKIHDELEKRKIRRLEAEFFCLKGEFFHGFLAWLPNSTHAQTRV